MPKRTEFSDVIFTEQRNFTTAEWRNGNRRTAQVGRVTAGKWLDIIYNTKLQFYLIYANYVQ